MKKKQITGFLPLCRTEALERGWEQPDFVYVTGDAYVDHPSFGVSIISRVLAAEGFSVCIIAQPDYHSAEAFREYGRPRLGFLVSSGNLDSMVANYTVAKRRRSYDYYSPGGKPGLRPDRAVIVYCNRIREAYGDVPIIIGGLEASLRRCAHYDYWDDRVRNSILVDSGADLLTYGMGENIMIRLAKLLDRGIPISKIRDLRGTVYLASADERLHYESVGGWSIDELRTDRALYAEAFATQYRENDHIRGRAVTERYGDRILVQNPPMPPLEREELDRVYALPYERTYHPSYEADGGIPAICEVRFSITHNRGCFGGCAFCAIAYHQGRAVRSRSIDSVVREAELLTKLPDFKGYIHDVGGPTANFRGPACERQLEYGVCPNRRCLTPTPCPNLIADHSEYIELLQRVESIPGIKKVFIRSGIRYDYMLADKSDAFFRRLVEKHVSGQLKVAPEHCSDHVLALMGKPPIGVFERFSERYFSLCSRAGLDQYLVPYLMSSHPGSTLRDAVELAVYLHNNGCTPEQVQDFYPTPGTASTVMYYTGIDPMTGKKVPITDDPHEKKLQRALLQSYRSENAPLVREALRRVGREDLIGYGRECLVRPENGGGHDGAQNGRGGRNGRGGSPNDGGRYGRGNSPRGDSRNERGSSPRGNGRDGRGSSSHGSSRNEHGNSPRSGGRNERESSPRSGNRNTRGNQPRGGIRNERGGSQYGAKKNVHKKR